ncbi:DNA polymerase III subunit alpha [Mycoplasma sp. 1781]
MKLNNLHLNTTFSFLESTITVDEAIKQALNSGINYLAFTEKNHFFSLAEANKKCMENNIKANFGLDVKLMIDDQWYQFILFAKHQKGFEILKKLSYQLLNNEIIYLNNILNFEDDIVIIENPILSYFKLTKNVINKSNYYIGFTIIDIEKNKEFCSYFQNILVVNNFNTVDFQDFMIIELLNKMNNKTNNILFDGTLFFDVDDEDGLMNKLVNRTNAFVESIYFEHQKNKYNLPFFKNEQNLDSKGYLKFLIWEKIKNNNKIKALFENQAYKDRLLKEFQIISQLRFEDYFLIIQDWINWARKKGISIGPGRGSAAGSLVSYILGITEIDPIKYNLIFERFLNPKRISMPDIDVDVQDDQRHEIINYLVQKYGYECVANIVTFSVLGKKSAIRDVLRTYKDVSSDKINQVSKLISSDDRSLFEEANKNTAFISALQQIKPTDNSFAKNVINQTSRISGFYRQTGTHAAGIVISSRPIMELVPTFKNIDNFQQTQFSMEYLDYFGLIKMDILGLRTLSTIKQIEDEVKKKTKKDIDWDIIDYNDQKTFDLLSQGNTSGIFQVESPIMIKALKQIKVSTFEDISAIISLNRPGPMAYVSSYAKRKAGIEPIPSISLEYDEIVKDTYGIIIYQEQIMQIVQKVANMTFEEADLFRKIISKKKADEMNEIKDSFIGQATKNGYSLEVANKIFSNIEKFADYGFNKSHAVAYSMLTFKMAYLKANFPLEFYSSCITSSNGAQATISKYANEAKTMGIQIVSPEINLSTNKAIISDNKIILPLGLIKGIGPEIIRIIINDRKVNGQYKNFLHCYFSLFKIKTFGKSTLETLIKANALRNFKLSQKTMLEEIDSSSNSSVFVQQNLFKNTVDIVDKIINCEPQNVYEDEAPIVEKNEIELLGQIYNYSTTQNYEIDGNRLIDTRPNNEYVMIVQCVNVIVGNDKNGRQYQRIDFQDSSFKVVAFMFRVDPELSKLKRRLVKIKFIRKLDNKIILRNYEVIK